MPVMESVPGKIMKFQGRDCLMWSINNYLGLAENEAVRDAAVEAAKVWGSSGPMGSRMMSGNTVEHISFEKALADFSQKEASILFNYGYLGVIGTIASIVGPDDIIIMDKLVHDDLSSLEKRLQSAREKTKGGVLILTEGVYGMTGDLARLDGISALKDRYGARLFVDDAHGVGVMGPNGRGTAEYFGVQDRIDLYFGTFAKAFASIGGYTAAKEEVVEWIRYNARTQVFAKSLPMIYVKALQKTLELVRGGSDRRERLFDISRKLSAGLRELGYYVGDVRSPLVPVFIPEGSAAIAMEWITYLRNKGIFVTGVTYPVIPKNYIMFRMVPTASHTDEDVARTIEAFKSLRDDRNIPLNYDIAAISTIYGDAE
jgi:glycine C-acetyltransferase